MTTPNKGCTGRCIKHKLFTFKGKTRLGTCPNSQPLTCNLPIVEHAMSTGADGKIHVKSVKKPTIVEAKASLTTPTGKLTAALEKKVKALEFQDDHPKPEEVKEAKKEGPKKTAPPKAAPVKDHGGMKR